MLSTGLFACEWRDYVQLWHIGGKTFPVHCPLPLSDQKTSRYESMVWEYKYTKLQYTTVYSEEVRVTRYSP